MLRLPASPLPDLRTIELGRGDEPLLQRFFERNPLYFQVTGGAPAGPDEADDEIHGDLPAGWPYTCKWVFGYARADGELDAMANVISDLLAPGVWHLGTFIVATARHGNGDAQALYDSIEQWARARGAVWMRLGVSLANPRAMRFWERQGFVELRTRSGVQLAGRANTISTRVKPLGAETIEQYLAKVARDHRDAP